MFKGVREVCLRYKFNFWSVHGIVNTSGLLHFISEASTLQETWCVHDSISRPKLNLLLMFTFYYEYLFITYLGNKNSFVFNIMLSY